MKLDVRFSERPVEAPARNVIAIVRGSDPALRNEYVAIGAHSDHIANAARAVDHDSLLAYNRVMRPNGADPRVARTAPVTPAEIARIAAIRDSLGKLRAPRRDSIYNGADDDGSGSVALLEIAENLAGRNRPRRSVLIVWHTGEESGLLGSAWFTDHTTVPHDSIVAQINMDMVGRGEKRDNPVAGPGASDRPWSGPAAGSRRSRRFSQCSAEGTVQHRLLVRRAAPRSESLLQKRSLHVRAYRDSNRVHLTRLSSRLSHGDR